LKESGPATRCSSNVEWAIEARGSGGKPFINALTLVASKFEQLKKVKHSFAWPGWMFFQSVPKAYGGNGG